MNCLNTRSFAVSLALLLGFSWSTPSHADVPLADKPIAAGADVPGNLALALSVEFPTAISIANLGDYNDANQYLGYFDPAKCYTYIFNSATPSSSYFSPTSMAHNYPSQHDCSGGGGPGPGTASWSGNFMNWAAMQTIDPFRWALTGGYRSVDISGQTILEKAWGSAQGSAGSNFPYRGTNQGGGNRLNSSLVQKLTPFNSWNSFDLGIWANGNAMVFSGNNSNYNANFTGVGDLSDVSGANTSAGAAAGPYRVFIRVAVCDSTLGTSMLESNCVQYGANYKPEGLVQQYSKKIRFSAFGYLNEGGDVRQGGVLRAPMGFVGPQVPDPLSTTLSPNPKTEWDPGTGIMGINPDTASASAPNPGVSQSGVMNYLNKFGEFGQTYKTYDNVGELYYAAVRYFENLNNVPEWTNGASPTALDGFPAVTNWADPVLYSCQKNFILGIGDDHTWYDYNVGGNTSVTGGRPMPPLVAADTFNKATIWTNAWQGLEGMAQNANWPFDSGATYFIAGLAYGVHVNDIRTDATMPGTQTISTYWMDVAEGQHLENNNPYYFAAKYGGFNPAGPIPSFPYNTVIPPSTTPTPPPYDMAAVANTLTTPMFDTTGLNVPMASISPPLPDNYFNAGNAAGMVAGLKSAFVSIANAITQISTNFSFSLPNVSAGGTESFGANFDSGSWDGIVTGFTLTFDADGNPSQAAVWSSSSTLQSQLAGTGWQTGRKVVMWNGTSGVAFQNANLSAGLRTALSPSYSPSLTCTTTACPYLDYMRGDTTQEVANPATGVGITHSLRTRKLLMGDIVDASLTPVTTPIQTYSDANNPGYNNFKTQYTSTTPRPTTVYAASNDGMLHAFDGTSGSEVFAFVPAGVIRGPSGTPQVDGIVEFGSPTYQHHNYVDATPFAFDLDMSRTCALADGPIGCIGTPTGDWHTLLIGGLGKGGRSFYALDVTDPAGIAAGTEAAAAANVKWEFTNTTPGVAGTMGFSYGAPVVVKTLKYGWVVILTSGYNNADGFGYLYFVNPVTGQLLEKVQTPSASPGMTQASAFVKDFSDNTADSVYVGDLGGQVWRFDLTGVPGSGPYPQPELLFTATDGGGAAQPITTAPLIEIHPVTRKRYVLFGTGVLLAVTDVPSTQQQSFYSIIDGTASGFNAVATPITRSNLTPVLQANLTTINTIAAGNKGWYTDLGRDPANPVTGIGWRVLLNPQAFNGVVAFATSLTTATDPCSPQGTSRVYALDYATVTSVLQPSPLPFDVYTVAAINLRFAGANGNPELIVGFTQGSPEKVPAVLTSTLATRILNWREVPTVE